MDESKHNPDHIFVTGKSKAITQEDSHPAVGKSNSLHLIDMADMAVVTSQHYPPLSPPPLLNCPTPLLMSNTSQWLYHTGQCQTNTEGIV